MTNRSLGNWSGLMIMVMIQYKKTGKVGCCKVDGEGSEVDHKRLIDHDGQGVGLWDYPPGSQGVNREV